MLMHECHCDIFITIGNGKSIGVDKDTRIWLVETNSRRNEGILLGRGPSGLESIKYAADRLSIHVED